MHGKFVVLTLTNSQLFFEVVKGIEFMRSVKLLVVFSVSLKIGMSIAALMT